jgi:hypothetical protein
MDWIEITLARGWDDHRRAQEQAIYSASEAREKTARQVTAGRCSRQEKSIIFDQIFYRPYDSGQHAIQITDV